LVALIDSDIDDAQPADLGGNGKFLPGNHGAVAGDGMGHRPDLGRCDGHRQNWLLLHRRDRGSLWCRSHAQQGKCDRRDGKDGGRERSKDPRPSVTSAPDTPVL
jgi:hypothetical protein